ncbi:MAG TPA: hypothetical protein VM282_21380 [Acidimicrobiales bacterium]|nr:hypothetical protein [Acidimicrobiales bacterium]
MIVDKPGSMRVETVPHLLGSNRRPIGARGLYAYWQTGSEATVETASRLLLDKTSA